MKTLLATICACLALGLVAAGCGGDDDNDDSGAAPAATTEKPADTGGGGGDTSGGGGKGNVAVTMKDIAFDPAEAKVPKGGSVTWTNDDSVGHDVTKTSGPGPDFQSGDPGALSSGDTFTQKFTKPGVVEYVCTVHPGMEGSVVVGK